MMQGHAVDGTATCNHPRLAPGRGACAQRWLQAIAESPPLRLSWREWGRNIPRPRVHEGRRQLWLRDDLDNAILPPELAAVRDLAEDL